MEAIWADSALRDLVQALDYIVHDDPEAAIEMAGKIDLTVKRIEQLPESGRLGKIKGHERQLLTITSRRID